MRYLHKKLLTKANNLPSSLPPSLPSTLLSFLPSFLPSLRSFPSFLPFFPSLLSFLPFFPSFPSFLPSLFPSHLSFPSFLHIFPSDFAGSRQLSESKWHTCQENMRYRAKQIVSCFPATAQVAKDSPEIAISVVSLGASLGAGGIRIMQLTPNFPPHAGAL